MPGDDHSLFDAILPTFVEELHEHVDALNRNLLGLEGEIPADERTQLLNELFRTAHTLKGASAMISVDLLENTCHQFEEILTALRKGALEFAPNLLQLLFEMCDGIQDAGKRLSDHLPLDDADLHAIIPKLALVMMDVDWQRFEEVTAAGGKDLETDDEAPDPQPTRPVDSLSARPAPAAPQLIDPLADMFEPKEAERSEDEESEERLFYGDAASDSASSRAAGRQARFFKVTADKIDALVAKAGDLLATRDRMDTRAEEVLALQDAVARWRSEWIQTRETLRTLTATLAPDRARRERDPIAAKLESIFDVFYQRLSELGKEIDNLSSHLSIDRSTFRQSVIPMEEDIRSMRMVPFSEACSGFERMVRDVARLGHKEVRLEIRGADVELDRTVLEAIKDPLRHLVRNAVDHGIEAPATRIAQNKATEATVTVSAEIRGPLVEIAVADDGRGIHHDAIRVKAEARGMAVPTDRRQLVSLIFEPGFSTAEKVTQISGRGVGLDVVKATIESLHGSIGVESDPGKGTKFALALPLTLTTIRVLLVRASGHLFATLATSVDQLLHLRTDDIRMVGGRPVLSLGSELLPVASLAETLGLETRALDDRNHCSAVIVAADNRRVAFLVDEFLSEQQVVVKSLGERMRAVRNVSGASVLSGGEIVLILNSGELVRSVQGSTWVASNVVSVSKPVAAKRILLVDDTPTTRLLQKSILESAGYEVSLAVDGVEAWGKLASEHIDAVISDIDMPRKDGITLTAEIRTNEALRHLPIILVTGRGSDADKKRGADAGANAYVVKSSFDHQSLLEMIARLV